MQFKQVLRNAMIIGISMMMVVVSGVVQGQEENLLKNPGFEEGFTGSGDAIVASDWETWVADDTNAPDFQETPLFFPSSQADENSLIPQIRSGSDGQALYSFFATHDAGIYQEVSGITEGAELRFSIYAHVFSNTSSDLEQSTAPGGVAVRVGIDPDGGTDPFADEIVYSEPFITYDTFIQFNIIATADSDTVTVFVRSTVTEPVQNTVVFLDDAVLNVTPESAVGNDDDDEPTDEPSEEPTEEETDDNGSSSGSSGSSSDGDPTPTREGVEETDEPTDEPTEEEPTDEPSEEPTEEEPTGEPSEEPTEEDPTDEPDDDEPLTEDFPGTILHTVRPGDTVGRLAVRYGSSTQAIIQANALDESALIFVGQGLVVPVRIVPATETPSPAPQVIVVTATESFGTGGQVTTSYTVAPGDTLSSIARRFNTTVGTLVNLNGIVNANRILVGQVLTLPGGGTPEPTATPVPATSVPEPDDTAVDTSDDAATGTGGSTVYTVRPGDNLYRIALANGVSLSALAEANNITNFNLIFVGQELTIP